MDLNQQFRYVIYKITNTKNGKIYVGCHKTKNSHDDYMGSGKLLKRAIQKYRISGFHWVGRKHKESTKRKISAKLSIAQTGEKNSQFGTCWICFPEKMVNRRIKKCEVGDFLSNGWIVGRKMTFTSG